MTPDATPPGTRSAITTEVPPAVSQRMMALHLLVLFNFAVSQPVFDLLSGRLAFLRDLRISPGVIYGLTFVMAIGLPTLIILGTSSFRAAGRTAFASAHSAALAVLMCLLAMPMFKNTTFLPSVVVYLGSVVLGLAGTRFYWKSSRFRLLLTYCAVGVPLFPALFLMRYSTSTVTTYAATQRTSRWTPAPVVVIVFDEFCGSSLMTPEREIDAARFPNFAALAQDGQWFRNAASVHELTVHAVPAILTGCYANPGAWPTGFNDRPQNLFSMLVGSGGYRHAAFEPVSRLAPEESIGVDSASDLLSVRVPVLISVLSRVYLHHLTPVEQVHCLPKVPLLWFGVHTESDINRHAQRGTFRYRWSAHRSQQFQHFLETIDGDESPSVHFLHILLPHVPWSYLPSGHRYTDDGQDWELLHLGSQQDGWSADELQVVHAQQRYLLQLMYLDQLLGQVTAKLRATGMYDRTLLVVTADHGISFRTNANRRAPSDKNRDEILSVPLFIKRPGETQTGVNDLPVETVDIFPTMADVLGYQLTQKVDGRSVFDTGQTPRQTTQYGHRPALAESPVDAIVRSQVPREIRQRFGSGQGVDALFRIGPLPELLGRKVSEFLPGPTPALTVDLSRFGDVWPSDPNDAVPCFYEGKVQNHNPVDDEPVVLAISVNGVIQAVTRTYRHAAELSQWETLVPAAAFRPGKNDVQILQVTGRGPSWTLVPCVLNQTPRPPQDPSA